MEVVLTAKTVIIKVEDCKRGVSSDQGDVGSVGLVFVVMMQVYVIADEKFAVIEAMVFMQAENVV